MSFISLKLINVESQKEIVVTEKTSEAQIYIHGKDSYHYHMILVT